MADNAQGPKPPAIEVEERRKKLLKEINRIDNWTNAAADNGLFDKQKKVPASAFENIQCKLKEARKHLYSDDFSDADYYTSLAIRAYDSALYSSSRTWRFSNIYAGHIWIYLITFLVGLERTLLVSVRFQFFETTCAYSGGRTSCSHLGHSRRDTTRSMVSKG